VSRAVRKWPVGQGARSLLHINQHGLPQTHFASKQRRIQVLSFSYRLYFFFFKSLSWSFRGMDDKWRDSSSLKQQSKDKSGVFILILMIFDLVLLLSDLKQQSWAGTATSAAWPRANGWMMRSFSVRHRVRSPFGLRRPAAGSAKSRYNIYTLNRYFCSLVSFDYDLFT